MKFFQALCSHRSYLFCASVYCASLLCLTAYSKPRLIAQGSAINAAPPASLYELDNKMRVLIVSDMRNPLAAMRLVLDAGSLRDQKGKTGLAHFFEHMMFRKTKSLPEGHFDRTLAGVGGRGNASTGPSWVEYETSFPGPAFDTILELEKQRFLELELQEPYFTIEKGAVISERRLRYENDPSARGSEILQNKIEVDSSFEWQGIGSKLDIENMKLEDAREFYKNHYSPENTILSVGGPFEPAEILAKIDNAFGKWQSPLKKQKIEIPQNYFTRHKGKSFICGAAVFEKTIQLNFPSFDRSYENTLYMSMLQLMLDSHPEGKLAYRFQKQNLGQYIAPYQLTWQRESVPFRVYFKLNANTEHAKAESFFWNELKRVLSMPVSNETKQTYLKQQRIEESEISSRMSTLLEMYQGNLYDYGDMLISKNRAEFVQKLTTSTMHNWINKKFNKDNYYTFGIVPTEQAIPCEKFAEAK